jgi:hypothetical protein
VTARSDKRIARNVGSESYSAMLHRKLIVVSARNPLACLLVWQLLLVSGCGGGLPETAPVRGVVTFDGKPLSGFQHAAVAFTPSAGRPAKGVISLNDGSFELSTYKSGDGARVGRHTVAVSATVDEPNSKTDDRYPGVRFVIPEKFADRDTAGLVYEVNTRSNVVEIQLRSNGTGTIVAQ